MYKMGGGKSILYNKTNMENNPRKLSFLFYVLIAIGIVISVELALIYGYLLTWEIIP